MIDSFSCILLCANAYIDSFYHKIRHKFYTPAILFLTSFPDALVTFVSDRDMWRPLQPVLSTGPEHQGQHIQVRPVFLTLTKTLDLLSTLLFLHQVCKNNLYKHKLKRHRNLHQNMQQRTTAELPSLKSQLQITAAKFGSRRQYVVWQLEISGLPNYFTRNLKQKITSWAPPDQASGLSNPHEKVASIIYSVVRCPIQRRQFKNAANLSRLIG